MRKFLPVLFLSCFLFVVSAFTVFAQTPPAVPDDTWVVDPEVTFTGKNAARSGLLLDWTLRDYQWASSTAGLQNPILPFWALIRNLIYILMILFVMATAFILIATRGKSLTIKKVIPRFIWVFVLIYFSFSLVQFIYQSFDAVQGFFLRSDINRSCPPTCISQTDLLYVGWQYGPFFGLRKSGDMNAESAFMSLLFVKITALTYYTMVITLIIRKVILWFFIIVSPVFPLLLFYYPLRNTAKIWVGEFFRWLLYGPLFSIFLAGLVALWRTRIPMQFNLDSPQSRIVFPTSINILLGGPGQQVALDNSINNPDTFALYLVALVMLWMVILVPWILLRIFLDHAWSFFTTEGAGMQQVLNIVRNRVTPPPAIPPVGPPSQPTGTARLPFKQYAIPELPKGAGQALQLPIANVNSSTQQVNQDLLRQNFVNNELLNLTNLSIPTIRDIAKYETLSRSSDTRSQSEVTRMRETLIQVANPTIVTNTLDRERITKIRDRLVQTSQQGNNVANSILHAANIASNSNIMNMNHQINSGINNVLTQIANPEKVESSQEKEKLKELREVLIKESQQGNELATTILSSTKELSSNKDTTTLKGEQLRDIKEKLIEASLNGDKAANSILSKAITQVDTGALQTTLMKLDNPSILTEVKEKDRFTKVKDKLIEAQKQGSQLASFLLSGILDVSGNRATPQEMQTIKEKLVEAKEKGDLLAVDMLTIVAAQATIITPSATILPQNNRIQQVSLEDYEAVKKMWVENYKNMEEESSLNKKKTIEGDIAQINEIMTLLSSDNPAQIEQGMEQVGNILPFLLLGGFTKDEIVAYLRAKSEAGKTVLEEIRVKEEEEDTLVTVKTSTNSQHAEKAQAQAVNLPEEDDIESSSLDSLAASKPQKAPENVYVTMINMSIPSMRDIARFDYATVTSKTAEKNELEKLKNILISLSEPDQTVLENQKEKIKEVHEKLIQDKNQGNSTADALLHASEQMAKTKDINNPEHIFLPSTNQLQQVSIEDYEAVKKEWIEHYQLNEPPTGVDRKTWILGDINIINEILGLLSSENKSDVNAGIQRLSSVLPLILLGGFSLLETKAYLTSKLEAGKFVLGEIEKNDSTSVQIPVSQNNVQQNQTMAVPTTSTK